MADRPARRSSLQVHLDYAFDRLRDSKLAQAYDILVPERERVVGARIKETEHEDSSDLRAGVVRAATRGTHHCQPNGSADRVREEPRFGGAEGMGVRRR